MGVEAREVHAHERAIVEQRRRTCAHADEERDPLVEPASDEAEHLLRCDVGPVRVVHDLDERLIARREQAQHGRTDCKGRRAHTGAELENAVQQRRLTAFELVQPVSQRPQERLQRREGNGALRLDAGGAVTPRLLAALLAEPDSACHAGGRGFESRRSRRLKCLQISTLCCQKRRGAKPRGPNPWPKRFAKRPANGALRPRVCSRSHDLNQVTSDSWRGMLPVQAKGEEENRERCSGSRRPAAPEPRAPLEAPPRHLAGRPHERRRIARRHGQAQVGATRPSLVVTYAPGRPALAPESSKASLIAARLRSSCLCMKRPRIGSSRRSVPFGLNSIRITRRAPLSVAETRPSPWHRGGKSDPRTSTRAAGRSARVRSS